MQRQRRAVGVGAGLVALYMLWMVFGVGGRVVSRDVDDLAMLVAAAIAAEACRRAAGRTSGTARGAWRWLAGSALAWTIGQLIWTVIEVVRDRPPSFPGVADVGFLLAGPLAVLGVLRLPTTKLLTPVARISDALQGVIVAGSLLFVLWAAVLQHLWHQAGLGMSAAVSALAFPFSAIVLGAVVLHAVVLAPRAHRRSIALLTAGTAIMAAGHTAYAYLTLVGRYATGNLLDVAWVGGYALVAWAAILVVDSPAEAQERRDPGRATAIVMAWLPLLALLVTALVEQVRHGRLDSTLVWIGVITGFFTVVRQMLAQVETRGLSEELAIQLDAVGRSEERYRALVEGSPDAIVIYADDVVQFVNPAALRLLGASTPDELIGRPMIDLVHPDDRPVGNARMAITQRERQEAPIDEFRVIGVDGRESYVSVTSLPFAWDGRPGGMTVAQDVTARHQAARRLMASEERFRRAFRDAGTGMIIARDDGTIVEVNPALCRMLECEVDTLLGRDWHDLIAAADRARCRASVDELLAGRLSTAGGEHRCTTASGRELWVSATATAVPDPDGDGRLVIAQWQDITLRRAVEDELAHQVRHDHLTGLPNRLYLFEHLRSRIEERADDERFALLFIDLDQFKLVNDSYGHHTGDAVLLEQAARLSAGVRPGDFVARLAGDEFVLICDGVGTASDAEKVAERIGRELSAPMHIGGHDLTFTASIGIAIADGTSDAEALMADADMAMFEAKTSGRARHVAYGAALQGRSRLRLETLQRLRQAVNEGLLTVVYQPIVDLRTSEVLAFEALARWHDEELGHVAPDLFIALAEESGLIVDLGRHVLRRACSQLATWLAAGNTDVTMAVNVSRRQLVHEDFAATVAAALAEAGVPAENLTIEITESAVLDDPELAIKVLERVRALGVRVSMDDFGTGYSSLAYLTRLPIDTIKIDRSFVDGLGRTHADDEIVTMILSLAGAMNLDVVAEGVETDRQRDILLLLGCQHAQGYLFGRPAPAEEGDRLLAQAAPVLPTT